MSRRSARIMPKLADVLRRFWWATVSGFTVIGATLYGGAPVGAAWQRIVDVPPDPRPEPDAEPDGMTLCPSYDDAVCREAAEGLAQIEAFLAAYGDTPRGGERN